jgi:hypothetical protein
LALTINGEFVSVGAGLTRSKLKSSIITSEDRQ